MVFKQGGVLTLLEQQIAELGGEEAQRVEATRLLRPERPQCRLVPAPERLVRVRVRVRVRARATAVPPR